jgi:LmbE family N-acetylglucosaminyl deacetylase
VAPHPDDDVIGAGGLLALEAARGRRVVVIHATDGRGAPRPAGGPSDEELARIRREEAAAGLRELGIHQSHTLAHRSDQLGEPLVADLHRVLVAIRPADVLVTAPQEPHATHRRVTAATLAALRRAALQPAPRLWGYPVWGDLWGETGVAVVDISAVADRKRQAIAAHRSQCEAGHYDEGALARNRADAVFLETHALTTPTHVERFLDLTPLLADPDLSPTTFLQQRALEELP